MNETLAIAALWRALAAGLLLLCCMTPLAAQPALAPAATVSAQRLFERLQGLGVLDGWMQQEVLAVALPLVQAEGGRFSGVQVNGPPRPGWLSVYLVDRRRWPAGATLTDRAVAVGPEQLSAGAWTHAESGAILLETAYWKRLAAATLMTQRKAPGPMARALATVDLRGLDALSGLWDEGTLHQEALANRHALQLVQGALGYALAHEMGHVGQAAVVPEAVRPPALPPPRSSERLRDHATACDEFRTASDEAVRAAERAADRHAATLVGRLCRVPDGGPRRHEITTLGATWFLNAALVDKVLTLGRSGRTTSVIDGRLHELLGADLYGALVAGKGHGPTKGVVAIAFPSSHPPDTERMRAFEQVLAASPCGTGQWVPGDSDALEPTRRAMCLSLEGAR